MLMLQAMLLSFASDSRDFVAHARMIGGSSWRAFVLYVVLLGVLGAWCLPGREMSGHTATGRRIMFAATLLGPLPLWLLFNGFLDANVVDMTALWLFPFAVLFAGAFLSRDWQGLFRMIVVGISIPVSSLLFLSTFVAGGN